MKLKEILETGIELSKVLNILKPSPDHEESNRYFLAWYIIAATTFDHDLEKGIAHKILEARETPLPNLQREAIAETLYKSNSLSLSVVI